MIPAINASKIYSTLGNNSSLVPLAVKDVANSLGLTTGSYIVGDSLEGKDRFLDEFGTQAIWLFGLPVYKKITDITLYKTLKIDPEVDIRLLDNPEMLDKAIELTPELTNKKVKESLISMKNNPKLSKALGLTKFGVATILTIASYTMLTKYRHKKTKEAARKEILKEQTQSKKQDRYNNTKVAFGEFVKNLNIQHDKHPAFMGATSAISRLKTFMFDPVQNLMIVDGAITTERLTSARNKQDFIGYLIKEGATWAFMYFASKPLQNFLEKKSLQKYNKAIDLDARVIESDELKKAFSDNNVIEKSLQDFPIKGTDAEIYEYLYKNPDNFIVQMAKKSDEIATLGSTESFLNKLKNKLNLPHQEIPDKDAIDTRKFINIGSTKDKTGIKGIYQKIETLYTQYKNSGESLDTFLNKVKTLKRKSVIKNLSTCIAALGVAVPMVMVGIRYLSGNKDFQVKEDLKKELSKK